MDDACADPHGAHRGADEPVVIFGNEDRNPDPEQVDTIEAELRRLGKTYEFHRYDGAGHGFFATDRPNYRQQQAVDGWTKVFDFYARYLGGPPA